MVRGRKARKNATATSVALASTVNNFPDDQYCASPKRKDCKIDGESTKISHKAILQALSYSYAASGNVFVKEQTAQVNQQIFAPNEKSNTTTISRPYRIDSLTNDVLTDTVRNFDSDEQELGSDESEITIKNVATEAQIFNGLNGHCLINGSDATSPLNIYNYHPVILNGQFSKILRLNNTSRGEFEKNSANGGVAADIPADNNKVVTPTRQRKPTTPHRIVCPSPVKSGLLQKSPLALPVTNRNFVISPVCGPTKQKKNSRSRRKLMNGNQEKVEPQAVPPPIVGGVILTNGTLEKIGEKLQNEKLIEETEQLNDANKDTNYKLSPRKNQIRGIGYHHHVHRPHHFHQFHHQNNSHNDQELQNDDEVKEPKDKVTAKPPIVNGLTVNGNGKKLTNYFPVRRSVRKTKKVVQEEMHRNIEKAIIEGKEDGLKVKHFPGKGRGVIADRVFKRGEFVVEYIGDLISIAEANEREQKYALDENAGCYMYYFKFRNQQYCIDATPETGKMGRLVNHSRNGNLITKVVDIKGQPHLVLIAKDDIQPGEELNYDYGDRSKEALLHHPWLAL